MRAGKERRRMERMQDEPERETRHIKITIQDSHRPMQVIELSQEISEGVGSRFRVKGCRCRPLGWSGFGELIGKVIR